MFLRFCFPFFRFTPFTSTSFILWNLSFSVSANRFFEIVRTDTQRLSFSFEAQTLSYWRIERGSDRSFRLAHSQRGLRSDVIREIGGSLFKIVVIDKLFDHT